MDSHLQVIIDHEGNTRHMGLLPSSPAFKASVPLWEDLPGNALIPESQYREYEEPHPEGFEEKDQDGIGACAGHMLSESIELLRYVAGLPYVALSPWFAYGNAATWPFDTGSNIGQHLENGKTIGCAPEKRPEGSVLVKYKNWNRGSYSKEVYELAKLYRIEIGGMLTSDEAIGSALQSNEVVGFSITAGARIGSLDSEGVSPLGIGYNNHAVVAWGGMKRSKKRPGSPWLFKWLNSWGKSWGQGGWAWLPLKGITRYPGFEAYTLRAVFDVPGDPHSPPPLA